MPKPAETPKHPCLASLTSPTPQTLCPAPGPAPCSTPSTPKAPGALGGFRRSHRHCAWGQEPLRVLAAGVGVALQTHSPTPLVPAPLGNVLREGCASLGQGVYGCGSVLSGELPVSRRGAGWVSLQRGTAWSGRHMLPALPGSGDAPLIEEHPPGTARSVPAAWAAPSRWPREGRETRGRVSPQSSQSWGWPGPMRQRPNRTVGPARGAGAASALAAAAVPVPVAHKEVVVSQAPVRVPDGCSGIDQLSQRCRSQEQLRSLNPKANRDKCSPPSQRAWHQRAGAVPSPQSCLLSWLWVLTRSPCGELWCPPAPSPWPWSKDSTGATARPGRGQASQCPRSQRGASCPCLATGTGRTRTSGSCRGQHSCYHRNQCAVLGDTGPCWAKLGCSTLCLLMRFCFCFLGQPPKTRERVWLQ